MSLIKETTVCIAACLFPVTEMCFISLKRYYPSVKVLMTFDKKDFTNNTRKVFFQKFKNVKILEDKYDLMHASQMDRMFKMVDTKYGLSLDDDVYFKREGVIEKVESYLETGNYTAVGQKIQIIQRQHFMISPRLHPMFLLLKMDDYRKYDMTFKRMYEADFVSGSRKRSQDFYCDTAGYIYHDLMKYGLPYYDFNSDLDDYLHHFSSVSDWFRRKLNIDVMEYCDGYSIPEITPEFQKINELSDWEKMNLKNLTDYSKEAKKYHESVFPKVSILNRIEKRK